MLLDLDIDDPNLKLKIELQKQRASQYQKEKDNFNQYVNGIKDQRIRDIIDEYKNKEKDLKQIRIYVQLIMRTQLQYENITKIIDEDDKMEIADKIKELNLIQEQALKIQDIIIQNYISNKIQEINQIINQKYSQWIQQQFSSLDLLAKKTKQYDVLQIEQIKELFSFIDIIGLKYLKYIFAMNINKFDFHFIDYSKQTAVIENPDWFLKYLQDQLAEFIQNILDVDMDEIQYQDYLQSAAILTKGFLTQYIEVCINKRFLRDQDDFVKEPQLCIKFLDELYKFYNETKHLLAEHNLQVQISLMNNIISLLFKEGLLQSILNKENEIIQTKLLDTYEDQFKDDLKEVQKQKRLEVFLNLIDEFIVVWESFNLKYTLIQDEQIITIIRDSQYLIFKQLLQVCYAYFNMIQQLNQKDMEYIQYLQTFYIGLKTLKKTFRVPLQKALLSEFKKRTLDIINDKLQSTIQKQLQKKLFDEYINEELSQLLQLNKSIPLYQVNNTYAIQDDSPYFKKLNYYHIYAGQQLQQILQENIVNKHYTTEMIQSVMKVVTLKIIDYLLKQIQNRDKTINGFILYITIVVRTTFIICCDKSQLNQGKFQRKQLQRYKFIQTQNKKRFDDFIKAAQMKPHRLIKSDIDLMGQKIH